MKAKIKKAIKNLRESVSLFLFKRGLTDHAHKAGWDYYRI